MNKLPGRVGTVDLDSFMEAAWTADFGERVFRFDAFLSHNHGDDSHDLAALLAAEGVNVWHDGHADLRNRRVRSKVSAAMRASRYVVLCTSPSFRDSAWCRAEYLPALLAGRTSKALRVLVASRTDATRVPESVIGASRFVWPRQVKDMAALLIEGNRIPGLCPLDLDATADPPLELPAHLFSDAREPEWGDEARLADVEISDDVLRWCIRKFRELLLRGLSQVGPQAALALCSLVQRADAMAVTPDTLDAVAAVARCLSRSTEVDDRANAAGLMNWLLPARAGALEPLLEFIKREPNEDVVRVALEPLLLIGALPSSRLDELYVPLLRTANIRVSGLLGVFERLHPAIRVRVSTRGVDESVLPPLELISLAKERLGYLLERGPVPDTETGMDHLRPLLAISDLELELRALHAVLFKRGEYSLRVTGDEGVQLLSSAFDFYEQLVTRSEIADGLPLLHAAEYAVDYVVPGMLHCVAEPTLKERALPTWHAMCRVMARSPEYGSEVTHYDRGRRRVLQGASVEDALANLWIENT